MALARAVVAGLCAASPAPRGFLRSVEHGDPHVGPVGIANDRVAGPVEAGDVFGIDLHGFRHHPAG